MEKKYAKQIMNKDSVATCVADIKKGDSVFVKLDGVGKEYKATDDIDFGHKIAVKEIPQGEFVLKYGEPIGKATKDIKIGDWVHTHNVVDHYEVL